MGIVVINPIAPTQFMWVVEVLHDTLTGGRVLVVGAKIQRSINANVGIDKVLRINNLLDKQIKSTAKFTKTIVK